MTCFDQQHVAGVVMCLSQAGLQEAVDASACFPGSLLPTGEQAQRSLLGGEKPLEGEPRCPGLR